MTRFAYYLERAETFGRSAQHYIREEIRYGYEIRAYENARMAAHYGLAALAELDRVWGWER